LPEVGILVVDNDVASQRALKNVLDVEGWNVRIVPTASHALPELASGNWNLAIVNVSLLDMKGPLFTLLKELTEAGESPSDEGSANTSEELPGGSSKRSKDKLGHALEEGALGQASGEASGEATQAGVLQRRFRVMFLVPMTEAAKAQPILEQEGLPYSLKPYHLHDFLEKVSELLVESGAVEESIRGIGEFSNRKARRRARGTARSARRGTMFASREDYQMTEEEMAEFERQEEEDRKKREKELKERGYRY
jgi:CheY-like chemotaxis protein